MNARLDRLILDSNVRGAAMPADDGSL